MDKKSIHEEKFKNLLNELGDHLSSKYQKIISNFLDCYRKAIGNNFENEIPNLLLFIKLFNEQCKKPFVFESYHRKIRSPIDYYQFSLNFVRPLIDFDKSTLQGMDIFNWAAQKIKEKENIIFLSNHQTETDPQVLTLILEKTHPEIVKDIIYVAGERVVTDPLAIPFSMGCDLLCIYSRRYIDHPLELKAKKLLHNKQTMEKMSQLLKEGGKMIYVAPSGGRDRKNSQNIIEVAPFDPDSIEMFYLMSKKAKTPTHFIPLAMATYDILPPPETIQKELGEQRIANRAPIHVAFAPAFNMESFHEEHDKKERRKKRAEAIWQIVHNMYNRIS